MSTTSMTAVSPAGVVDGLRAELVGLTQTLWAAQSGTVLLDTVAALERLRSTLDAVVMPVVAEVDATDAAKAEGWSSTKDFLTAVTGGHRGAGAGLVRLARELTGPRGATLADLAGGRISRVQAEVVTRAVDQLPGDPVLRGRGEAVMLEHARVLDATALTRAGRHLVSVVDPDGEERAAERALAREERAAHLGRFLNIRDDGIGGVSIRGRASAEDGAMIRAALLPLAAPVPTDPGACGGTGTGPGSCGTDGCTHDGADPREHGARFLDALVEATRRLQSADLLPSSHGATPRITLTLGYLWLLHQHTSSHHNHHPAAAADGMDSGDPMSAEAARRLACDADLIPAVLGPEGQVLDVGRLQRLVTATIWVALVLRDQHCAFPGCHRLPIACHAHHIVHWVDGGPTSLDNLVLLCGMHHRLIHNTPWEVRLNPHDRQPEFLPPPRLDPHRHPLRHRRLRE